MKKAVFCFVLIVLFVVVMIATPYEELQYNFPLDEGTNKLAAATIALVAAIWGALDIKKALFIWGGMVVVMALLADVMLLGAGTIFSSLLMCAVAAIWANNDDEIKDFLLTPFKDEEEDK